MLPWSYLTMGTLAAAVVVPLRPGARRRGAAPDAPPAARATASASRSSTPGHGPLDLNHLIKRVCAEVEAEGSRAPQAMGLCYLELNAALGTGLGTDWPVAVDHGSTMETSWVAALEPDLVDIEPAARRSGRERSSASTARTRGSRSTPARGAAQIEAAATLLAERAAARAARRAA